MLELGLLVVVVLALAGSGSSASGGNGGSKKADIKTFGKKWQGKPESLSKDPAGYDTQKWQSGKVVAEYMRAAGYNPHEPSLIAGKKDPNGEVARFQSDWNKVARNPEYPSIKGSLAVDGLAGKNTLNALDHVELLGVPWQLAVVESGG